MSAHLHTACPVQNSDRLAEQILQMEMSQSNIQTVAALQQAAAAGKANLKANDIEDVDLVLDEIAEQNDQMVQITDALGQSTIGGIDEDDLEAELNVRRHRCTLSCVLGCRPASPAFLPMHLPLCDLPPVRHASRTFPQECGVIPLSCHEMDAAAATRQLPATALE